MVCNNIKCLYALYVIVLLLAIKLAIMAIHDLNTQRQFEAFIIRFNKTYSDGDPKASEYRRRFGQFEEAIEQIETLNANRVHDESAIYGITEFSDLSSDEFSSKMLNLRLDASQSRSKPVWVNPKSNRILRNVAIDMEDGLPTSMNWMDHGVVTTIRNQGSCGACWAHSVVETVESMLAIVRNESVRDLSVQQMVDCSASNHGCSGGDTCNLLNWLVIRDVPIVPMHLYPTTNSQSSCGMKNIDHVATDDYITVSSFTCESMIHRENRILEYLAHIGPITAGVNALTWQFYLGGIIQHHCDGNPNALNHAVQIVGYNRSGDVPFYIVRNSWGEQFGDRGYARIAIGSNLCGIAAQVSTISVK